MQHETRTLPPRPVVLRPIFASPSLSLSSPRFCLLSSPSCIFRLFSRIVSAMIHWILLTFFTRQAPKGVYTYASGTQTGQSTHREIHSGIFRTFVFFPRVKSSIFSPPPFSPLFDFHLPHQCFGVPRRPREKSDEGCRTRYIDGKYSRN